MQKNAFISAIEWPRILALPPKDIYATTYGIIKRKFGDTRKKKQPNQIFLRIFCMAASFHNEKSKNRKGNSTNRTKSQI